MLEIATSIILIIAIIVQVITMIYLLISTIKRDREDKIFWNEMHRKIEESFNLELPTPTKTEEEENSEQDK